MTSPTLVNMIPPLAGDTAERFSYKSSDGLTLAGVRWPGSDVESHKRVPVLCLAGLSRNTKDFQVVARRLADRGHDVIALDYRGRGRSDRDPDWQNYSLAIEAGDIDIAIDLLDLHRFAVLGTSRGGLHAMSMAARFGQDRLAGLILNDIGPKIERTGIERLAASIGKTVHFSDIDACAAMLSKGLRGQFPNLQDQDWLRFADQLGAAVPDGFELEYDPALAKTIVAMDDGTPLPDLWPLFETLTGIPVLILRGDFSDILSVETAHEMVARHPKAELFTVKGEGHAPLLWDGATQDLIAAFLESLRPTAN